VHRCIAGTQLFHECIVGPEYAPDDHQPKHLPTGGEGNVPGRRNVEPAQGFPSACGLDQRFKREIGGITAYSTSEATMNWWTIVWCVPEVKGAEADQARSDEGERPVVQQLAVRDESHESLGDVLGHHHARPAPPSATVRNNGGKARATQHTTALVLQPRPSSTSRRVLQHQST